MGRRFEVTKPEYIYKSFRLPAELVHQLEALAQNKSISLNQLVIQCCRFALDSLEDNE